MDTRHFDGQCAVLFALDEIVRQRLRVRREAPVGGGMREQSSGFQLWLVHEIAKVMAGLASHLLQHSFGRHNRSRLWWERRRRTLSGLGSLSWLCCFRGMMVMMVVVMRRNGRCLFGRRGGWSNAFEVFECGDSSSRGGSSFGRVVVMMVVAMKRLA